METQAVMRKTVIWKGIY